MELYLVRHAKAEAGPDDHLRRLTKGGQSAANEIGRALKQAQVTVDRIEHSPLVRARQTAETIAKYVHAPLVSVSDLRYDSDPQLVRERVWSDSAPSLMLVGHNPHIEMLAGLLITEVTGAPALAFGTCSVARLVSQPAGQGWRFVCEWLITPALVQR